MKTKNVVPLVSHRAIIEKLTPSLVLPKHRRSQKLLGTDKVSTLSCLWFIALLAGMSPQANAATGSRTYVATDVVFSSSFANGGTMTVTYTGGNDASIDPSAYGSSWLDTFTMTFSAGDVIPTDAFTGSPDLIYTSYSEQNYSSNAGLDQVVAELKIDWQSGMTALQKNNNYDETLLPKSSVNNDFEDTTIAMYNPTITGHYATDDYTANTNFVSSSEYAVESTSSLPTLDLGFSYNDSYSWGLGSSGSSQDSNEADDVTAAAKSYAYNMIKGGDFYDTSLTTISAEQMFILSNEYSTSLKTSGFGITNNVIFRDVVINYTSPVPEPSSLLSVCLTGSLLVMRRKR